MKQIIFNFHNLQFCLFSLEYLFTECLQNDYYQVPPFPIVTEPNIMTALFQINISLMLGYKKLIKNFILFCA